MRGGKATDGELQHVSFGTVLGDDGRGIETGTQLELARLDNAHWVHRRPNLVLAWF
jgi:hypothetical protein